MSGRAAALSRLAVVVGLTGAALALVSFSLLAAVAEVGRAALDGSGGPDVAVPVLLGVLGAECLVVALLMARGGPMGEDA